MEQYNENKVMWSPRPMRETAIGKFMDHLVEKKVLSQPFGELYVINVCLLLLINREISKTTSLYILLR